ncbi:uncharacterized protein LOC142349233 [Convolutriloba macropyga]|uniref:uncharacterized protein LOC142349233 n=1 Tax=Convolutriloba macropyga TaxID=536237 RepID=UPI003F51AE03
MVHHPYRGNWGAHHNPSTYKHFNFPNDKHYLPNTSYYSSHPNIARTSHYHGGFLGSSHGSYGQHYGDTHRLHKGYNGNFGYQGRGVYHAYQQGYHPQFAYQGQYGHNGQYGYHGRHL